MRRIIPADAGSTCRQQHRAADGRDHPRGCGEHAIVDTLRECENGSSPRMRGAPVGHESDDDVLGIIPADAGSTFPNWLTWLSDEDHPRGCGEHAGTRIGWRGTWGSSPRMRGAPNSTIQERSIGGIIPADAGSTCCKGTLPDSAADHPRGCGEHYPEAVS